MNLKRSLLGLATALLTAGAAGSYAQAGEFDGVTVNIITQTGAIAEPLQRRAPDFEKATGAKINIIAVPFSDLYQKALTDWASGTNSVDAAVFAPQWMVDYIAGGFLEDLSDRIAKDPAIKQDDVGAFFRDFSEKYNGKAYMVTLDGDFHMMYYRKDVLDAAGLKPPTTWDEYLAVAKAVNGKDMNGDGQPDFGSCIGKKRNMQSYWFVTDVVGSMTQSKGTSQGAFFNTKDMTPLVDNEAFRKALDFLNEIDQVRAAGRAQHGRHGHASPVHLRPLRAEPRLGRRRHALGRSGVQGHRQVGRLDHARLQAGARLGYREARRLHQGHLSLRDRRCQPCALRGLRRLGRRYQCGGQRQGEGRGLRLLLLHDPAGAVERGRHHRQDRLQSLPHLAVRL